MGPHVAAAPFAVRIVRPANRYSPWACLLVALGIPLSSIYGVVAGYTAAPYSDQFFELLWWERWLAGEASVFELWRLFHDHCLFIPRLFFIADYVLVDGTNVLLITANFALQGLTVGLVVSEMMRSTAFSAASKVFLTGVSVAVLFSAVQVENFVWGFQVQFILVFLCALAAIALLLQATGPGGSGRWVVASIVFAVMSTWSMANGVLLWPLLVGLALVRGAPLRHTVAIAAVGLLVIAHWQSLRDPGDGTLGRALADPFPLLLFTAMYLGSPLRLLGQSVAGNVGAVALVAAFVLLVASVLRLKHLTRFQLFHLSVLLFTLGTAAITALGRSSLGMGFALNSRYATCALLSWASMIFLCAYAWSRSINTPLMHFAAGSALAGGIAFALLPAHARSITEVILDGEKKSRGALALMVGVDDPGLGALVEPEANVLRHRAFLLSEGLSVFAETWTRQIGEPFEAFSSVSPLKTSSALRFVAPAPPGQVPRIETGMRILPGATTPEVSPSGREGYIVDDHGIIQGARIGEAHSWFGLARRTGTRPIAVVTNTGRLSYSTGSWHYVGALASLPSACTRTGWDLWGDSDTTQSASPEVPPEAGYVAPIVRPGATLFSPALDASDTDYLVVPYFVPTPSRARLAIIEEATAAVLIETQLHEYGYWANWTMPTDAISPTSDADFLLRVTLDGESDDANSWIAIGEPRRIPHNIDGAR